MCIGQLLQETQRNSACSVKALHKNHPPFRVMRPDSSPQFTFITFGCRETHFNTNSSVKAALACYVRANAWLNCSANSSLFRIARNTPEEEGRVESM